MRSSFAMTEPAPGGGSDPSMIKTYAEKHGDNWKIYGRKWFITGAAAASHFILAARTSDDKRKGITTFLYHKDQPGWRIVRRIDDHGTGGARRPLRAGVRRPRSARRRHSSAASATA